MINHVAIVGGGFSGALLAINLLRHEGPHATLIERAPGVGTGLAFGAAHPNHLLNVRADKMSALPDDPLHFARWLEQRGLEQAGNQFVPRLRYGQYLQGLLEQARAAAPERLTVVQGDACRIVDDTKVVLVDGGAIAADAVVLAVGNLPPHDPPGIDPDDLGPLYWPDPWAPGLAEGLDANSRVLVLGTGLTMIDVALSMKAQGYAGKIVALSRRGLLPHVHAPIDPPEPVGERPPATCVGLLRAVRAAAAEQGWRRAVDGLRPITQDLWRAADATERNRFLRHLRAWWDVHRHRLAPDVAARIEGMRAEGQLSIGGGKIQSAKREGDHIHVTWRARGDTELQSGTFDRIVNCTGPQGDLRRTEEPLLKALMQEGRVQPDALRIGIDVDWQAQVIGRNGAPEANLFAVGPMTRGAFWEIVAVPDIRIQSWALARRLSNAHWVGGEGL